MNKNKMIIGCPDPFSLAENIKGEAIDWSKVKDETDALAECFGITKESYTANSSLILRPFIKVNEKGEQAILSEEEAEERLTTFLTKNARPKNATRILKSKKEITVAQLRKNVTSHLLRKQVSDKEKTKIIKSGEVDGVGNTDDFYLPSGFKWQDKGYFFNETALWSDVCQNGIGDCYFLAALSSVAFVNSFLIKNVTGLRTHFENGTYKESPWHAIDFYVPNEDPANDFRNWNASKRKTVQTIVVSEDVLMDSTSNYNFGACGPKEKLSRSTSTTLSIGNKADFDSCWASIYEKAYAKFLETCTTDYPNMNGLIHGGWAEVALKEILHTEQVVVKNLSSLSEDEIWNIGYNTRSYPTCATISSGKSNYDYNANGLYTWHVYSFLGIYSVNNKKYVVLRNPHGRNPAALKNNPNVYHGSWGFSFGANIINTYRDTWDIYRYVGGSDNPQTSQGTFLLELSKFKEVFDTVEYYNGPALNYGATELKSETPIKAFKISNKGLYPIRIDLEYKDSEDGTYKTVNIATSLAAIKSKTIDLSTLNIKLRSSVKLIVSCSRTGKTQSSKIYTYHSRASKTTNVSVTSTSALTTLSES